MVMLQYEYAAGSLGWTEIGLIKWCEHRDDYAFFLQGGCWMQNWGGLTSSELFEIQQYLYGSEVKDYG